MLGCVALVIGIEEVKTPKSTPHTWEPVSMPSETALEAEEREHTRLMLVEGTSASKPADSESMDN
jgi:hypothetical protein